MFTVVLSGAAAKTLSAVADESFDSRMRDVVLRNARRLLTGCLALAALSMPALAVAQAAASGRIAMLNVPVHGQFVRIELDAPAINPGSCPGAEFYIAELTGPNANRILGALYAAHLSRATVTLWIHGCTSGQYWGMSRPNVFDVYWYAP